MTPRCADMPVVRSGRTNELRCRITWRVPCPAMSNVANREPMIRASLVPRVPMSERLRMVLLAFLVLFVELVAESNVAFGANLLGAVAGGVLEYTALITGYTALAILVAVLYGAAFLVGRRHFVPTLRTG